MAPVVVVNTCVADADPLLGLVDVDVAQAVRLDDVDLFVLAFAQMRIDDDGAIVAGVDQLWPVAVPLHGPHHTLELPWRRRRSREEEVPGDVDLERGVGVLRDNVLVSGEVHQLVVIP